MLTTPSLCFSPSAAPSQSLNILPWNMPSSQVPPPPSDFLHMTHSSRDHRTSTNLFCPTEAQLHGASRLCPRFKSSVNTLLSLHFTFCGPHYSAIPERFPASPQLVATVCPHSLPSSNSCGSWPRTITNHWGMS